MKEFFINNFVPVLWTAITGFLIIMIKGIAPHFVSLAVAILAILKQKLKQSGHEEELQTAKEIWGIVEEKYRVTENAKIILGKKADYFDKLLLAKLPGLKQEDLNHLRQAIAGEFNKDKAPVTTNEDYIKQLQDSNNSLQEQINQLTSEKADLQVKYDQLNNSINSLVQNSVQANDALPNQQVTTL
jgi:chromosome segregation ATPase